MKVSKQLLKTITAALAVGAISTTACTKQADWLQSEIDEAKLKIEQKSNPDAFECGPCGMG